MTSRLLEVLELLGYEKIDGLEHRSNLIQAILNFAELQQDDTLASECRQKIANIRTTIAWRSLK